MVNQGVSYGPYSTPSSIAASIATLVTRNYYQYGMSARAFGPNVIYSGNAVLGTVSNYATGSSFGTNNSPETGIAAENACESAPPPPPAPSTRLTLVGWLNGDEISLPSDANPDMASSYFPRGGPSAGTYAYCIDELLELSEQRLGGIPNTSADRAYASAWLLKYSANNAPPASINPATFTTLNYDYRLFADYSPSQGFTPLRLAILASRVERHSFISQGMPIQRMVTIQVICKAQA